MARYTVTVKSQCAGGEHVTLIVNRDGVPVRDMLITRTELRDVDLSWQEVLPFFLREVVKRSGATTPNQIRTAVEAASWEF